MEGVCLVDHKSAINLESHRHMGFIGDGCDYRIVNKSYLPEGLNRTRNLLR